VQVLVLEADQQRTDRIADAVDGTGGLVEVVSTVDEATERLAWPGIDCLVVGFDAETFDAAAVVAHVGDKHPTIPVVAVSASGVESDDVDAVVSAREPGVGERVAAAVEQLAPDPVDYSEWQTEAPTEPETLNVDPATVDRLLEEGLDRERLVELLHKSALFDEMMTSLPVHLYVKDRQARHLYTTEHFPNAPEWFLGNTDPEIGMTTDSHERRAFAEDRYVIETGDPILDKVEYLPMRDEWNLTSKVPWHGPDEEVVGLFGITWEITERMERQEQIRRQNERLDRFAEMISHDIGTPLSVARMHLRMAREPGETDEHLAEVEAALDRLEDLVDDVFELARQGKQVVDPSPVDLDSLVTMTWGAMDVPEATVETIDPLGTAIGDEGRLRRLFANLFGNAVEHVGIDVTVRVGRVDGEGFYVADDGPGLPETDTDLFEPGTTTKAEGTGLGLAIVREIAVGHGWTVEVTSGQDGGARFEFTGVEWTDDE